jgi:hypothetical protein
MASQAASEISDLEKAKTQTGAFPLLYPPPYDGGGEDDDGLGD